MKKHKNLKYVDIGVVDGKGAALIEGFKLGKGDYLGFADGDGATEAKYFYDMMLRMGDAEGIIASRWMDGSIMEPKQTFARRFASRGFNTLNKLLFGLHYYDTQCGCKLFERDAVLSVLPSLGITRWAFDIDLLYQFKRRKYHVKEIPTVWRDKVGTDLNVKKVSIQMLLAIVRLRLVYSPFRFVVGAYNKIAAAFGFKL